MTKLISIFSTSYNDMFIQKKYDVVHAWWVQGVGKILEYVLNGGMVYKVYDEQWSILV